MQDGTTGDEKIVVADLINIAHMGLAENHVVRFAHEGGAGGRYFDTWQSIGELVKQVNRPNFGLCLDTFHFAGRVWPW